jgi:hypothetical protein
MVLSPFIDKSAAVRIEPLLSQVFRPSCTELHWHDCYNRAQTKVANMGSLNSWLRRICTQLAGILVAVAAFSSCSSAQPAPGLKPETTKAFDKCLAEMETSILQKQSSTQHFVLVDNQTQQDYKKLVSRGGVVIREAEHCTVPDGLVHHWIAEAFMAGATNQDVLKVLKDVDDFPRIYSPRAVPPAKTISSSGDTRQIELTLKDTEYSITVAFDGTYDVHDGELDTLHAYSISRSLHMEIVEPKGKDYGIPWRLNTYWRLEQTPTGVFAECETISLTRDAPKGLGWLIHPFTTSIPKTSLQFTLTKTKNEVLCRQGSTPCTTAQRTDNE